jgi:lipopolysaccharide export system permease protein
VKILSRYILLESVVFFGISLFAFTGILLTMRMLRFAGLVVNKGVEFSQIATVFLAIVPTFLEIAIPLATLLGIMLAFARMSGDSEIVVMRASGVSLHQLFRPVLLFGVVAAFTSLFVSLQLSPWGFQVLSRSFFEIARSKSSAGLDEGVFNKMGDLTLYAEKIDHQTGKLQNVLIDDKRQKDNRRIVTAINGTLLPDEEQEHIILDLNNGMIHEVINGKYVMTAFITTTIVLDPQDMYGSDDKSDKSGREMHLDELHSEIAKYKALLISAQNPAPAPIPVFGPQPKPTAVASDNTSVKDIPIPELKKKISKLQTEAIRRFSMPFASFILALLGMPLGVQPPRTQRAWGVGLSGLLGMFVFIFYYGLLSIGIMLGERGSLNPIIGLWLPNLLSLAMGIFFIYKINSEQWQSIAHGFEGLTNFIRRKFKSA